MAPQKPLPSSRFPAAAAKPAEPSPFFAWPATPGAQGIG